MHFELIFNINNKCMLVWNNMSINNDNLYLSYIITEL